jgi:hypothetical protein
MDGKKDIEDNTSHSSIAILYWIMSDVMASATIHLSVAGTSSMRLGGAAAISTVLGHIPGYLDGRGSCDDEQAQIETQRLPP